MSRHHNSGIVKTELRDTIFLETSKGKKRERINLTIKSILSRWPYTILRAKDKKILIVQQLEVHCIMKEPANQAYMGREDPLN